MCILSQSGAWCVECVACWARALSNLWSLLGLGDYRHARAGSGTRRATPEVNLRSRWFGAGGGGRQGHMMAVWLDIEVTHTSSPSPNKGKALTSQDLEIMI
ncbi:hypothetical protein PoB_001212800 [Plakobranchus ocellatus]|uniref:Secreted protein n=1 Tax=Plakobranchus ocellatus TaxID=259542 RepID=A0AAV3YSU9_9GAST|nr:hypothetical protein PoB_001212800 [Plakobranchus ocellatus]